MVSMPPPASMRSLPGSAVKLSSPGVPVSQVLTLIVDLVGVDQRAARAAVAAVVGHERQRVGAEEVLRAAVDRRCRRRERGIDLRERAGERHAAGAAAGDRRAAGGRDRQRAVRDRRASWSACRRWHRHR